MMSPAHLQRPPGEVGDPVSPLQTPASHTSSVSSLLSFTSRVSQDTHRQPGISRLSSNGVGMIPIALSLSLSLSRPPGTAPTSEKTRTNMSRSPLGAQENRDDIISEDYILPSTTYKTAATTTTTPLTQASQPDYEGYSSSVYDSESDKAATPPREMSPARPGRSEDENPYHPPQTRPSFGGRQDPRDVIPGYPVEDVPVTPTQLGPAWPTQEHQYPAKKDNSFLRMLRQSLMPALLSNGGRTKSRLTSFLPSSDGGWWEMLDNIMQKTPAQSGSTGRSRALLQTHSKGEFDPANVV
ncbi:hypothetical protein B0T17DRAFT_216278 [Bombardia bombarda]|uniref:Uncharacterized protein n=1 Tax=Bombardia bombarda TaxID=252184 RepID=A0AA40CA89_9PEZI|nr:hypothetical protein B0T17DRAFT_216278 [Bombardia bombarda]